MGLNVMSLLGKFIKLYLKYINDVRRVNLIFDLFIVTFLAEQGLIKLTFSNYKKFIFEVGSYYLKVFLLYLLYRNVFTVFDFIILWNN